MKSFKRYARDPYWTKARFDSDCPRCGERIKKGEDIFYYPSNRSAYCHREACGQQCSREFGAAAQDEDFYNSQYSGRWE